MATLDPHGADPLGLAIGSRPLPAGPSSHTLLGVLTVEPLEVSPGCNFLRVGARGGTLVTMDTLMVAPDEVVTVSFRNNKAIRVTQHMYDALQLLRDHLKGSAQAKQTITYGEATAATNGAYLPQGWGPALDVLSEDCFRRGEPSLAALVVRSDDGEVGDAFVGDAPAERQACFDYWAQS